MSAADSIAPMVALVLDSAREMHRYHPFTPAPGSFPEGFVQACNELGERVYRLDQLIASVALERQSQCSDSESRKKPPRKKSR
jgi:hypothetical protein